VITIKTKSEIEKMRAAGLAVSKTHEYLKQFIVPGMSEKELNRLAEEYIRSLGGIPSCIGYCGYPTGLCISVNDTVVHGIPSDRTFRNGDIVSVDMVIGLDGYQGDAAWTYAVGEIDEQKKHLMEHTEKALYEGIAMVKPGNRIGDISYAVESYATAHGLGVVRELTGHGIGKSMHEDPNVPNYGVKGTGPVLRPGMTICIEPMLTAGKRFVYCLMDGWTVKTKDKRPAAHFEHTVLVTENGYEILTPRLS